MKQTYLRALALAAAFASCSYLAGPAKAQDGVIFGIDHYFQNLNYSQELDRIVENARPDGAAGPYASDEGDADKPTVAPPKPAAPVKLTYSYSPARRQAFMQKYVAQMKRDTPDNAAMIDQSFVQQDVLALSDKALRDYGMDPHNLSHVYAAYWVTAWDIANQNYAITSRDTMFAVIEQSKQALGNIGLFAKANDSEKQQISETLLMLTASLSSTGLHAKSDPAFAKEMAQTARVSAKKMGINLDGMTLTEQGFVPAGRRK